MFKKISGKERIYKGDNVQSSHNNELLPVVFDFGGDGWVSSSDGENLLKGYNAARANALSLVNYRCSFCGKSFVNHSNTTSLIDIVLKNPHVPIIDNQLYYVNRYGNERKEVVRPDDMIPCCFMCKPCFNLIEAGEVHNGKMIFLPEISQGDLSNYLRVIYMIKYYTSKGVFKKIQKPEPINENVASNADKNIYKDKLKTYENNKKAFERLSILLPMANSLLDFFNGRQFLCEQIYGSSRPQDFGRALEKCYQGAAEGSDDIFNKGSEGGVGLVPNSQEKLSTLNRIQSFDVDITAEKRAYDDRSKRMYGLRLLLPKLMNSGESMKSFVKLSDMDNAFDEGVKLFRKWKSISSNS